MSNYSELFYSCTEVSPTCPVQATVLGYYPNFGVNVFLAIGFCTCMLAALGLGARKRSWSYTVSIVAGSGLEFAGQFCFTHPSSSSLQHLICGPGRAFSQCTLPS